MQIGQRYKNPSTGLRCTVRNKPLQFAPVAYELGRVVEDYLGGILCPTTSPPTHFNQYLRYKSSQSTKYIGEKRERGLKSGVLGRGMALIGYRSLLWACLCLCNKQKDLPRDGYKLWSFITFFLLFNPLLRWRPKLQSGTKQEEENSIYSNRTKSFQNLKKEHEHLMIILKQEG